MRPEERLRRDAVARLGEAFDKHIAPALKDYFGMNGRWLLVDEPRMEVTGPTSTRLQKMQVILMVVREIEE